MRSPSISRLNDRIVASRFRGPIDELLYRADHNGQALSYVYYEQEPGRRAAAEVRRIATSIARLPELLSAAAKQDPNPLFAPEALMRQNPSKTKFCDG